MVNDLNRDAINKNNSCFNFSKINNVLNSLEPINV